MKRFNWEECQNKANEIVDNLSKNDLREQLAIVLMNFQAEITSFNINNASIIQTLRNNHSKPM